MGDQKMYLQLVNSNYLFHFTYLGYGQTSQIGSACFQPLTRLVYGVMTPEYQGQNMFNKIVSTEQLLH